MSKRLEVVAVGGGLDITLRDSLNSYLRLSEAETSGYVPVWGRIKTDPDSGVSSPLSLKALCEDFKTTFC